MLHRRAALMLTVFVCLLGLASPAAAEVALASIFGDHMVLQQNQPIRVFGQAEPGEAVTVTFNGQTATATADDAGRFRVELPAMVADEQAHELKVVGSNEIVLREVLLGEVWVCSGQSNMEWAMTRIMNSEAEIAAADLPRVRLFNVPQHLTAYTPQDQMPGQWAVCSPESVSGFSAVGYFFGRALHDELDVPIGLIGTNWGGTRIEPWTPRVGFEQVPALSDLLAKIKAIDPDNPEGRAAHEAYLAKVEQWIQASREAVAAGRRIDTPPAYPFEPPAGASKIYHAMVAPMTPLSVRGVIWYQGESNANDGLGYDALKEGLVTGWRTVFENPELSFYWVQLANFRQPEDNPAGDGWGPVREGQRRALRLPHTGMAVTIDIGDAGNIHPRNKQDVGRRLARWALAKNYGRADLVYSGPLFKDLTLEGNEAHLSFDHAAGGLFVGIKEGLDQPQETDKPIKRFAVQDAEGNWHWAQARIEGEKVVVWAEGVEAPQAVRFGYESNPAGPWLYNLAGLPASPFTTVD